MDLNDFFDAVGLENEIEELMRDGAREIVEEAKGSAGGSLLEDLKEEVIGSDYMSCLVHRIAELENFASNANKSFTDQDKKIQALEHELSRLRNPPKKLSWSEKFANYFFDA